MQPFQYINEPLVQQPMIDFSQIGRSRLMDKQNSMNMAAEERARTRQLDDEQRQRGYLTADRTYTEDQKLWDEQRAAERQVAERDRVEQERLAKAAEAKLRLKDAYAKNNPQVWADVIVDYPGIGDQVKFLVGDLDEQEKTASWAVSEKLNSISRSKLPDDEKKKLKNALIDENKIRYTNAGNKKMVAKFEGIQSLLNSGTDDALYTEAIINNRLNPDYDKLMTQAMEREKLRLENLETQGKTNKANAETAAIPVETESKRLANAKLKELSEPVQKLVNENASSSISDIKESAKMKDLADRIEQGISAGGIIPMGWSYARTLLGWEGTPEKLMTEYNGIRNKIAISNLPSGPPTDNDIKLALSGTPDKDARPETIASFLRGISKLKAYESKLSKAKSIWFEENNHLGKIGKEVDILGVKTKPKETFLEWQDRAGKELLGQTAPTPPQAQPKAGDRVFKFNPATGAFE